MSRWTDEATRTFLVAARDDLQRQIGRAGIVEQIDADSANDRVALVARIRTLGRAIEVRGSGENLIDAYAALRRAVPEPVLVTAFREFITR